MHENWMINLHISNRAFLFVREETSYELPFFFHFLNIFESENLENNFGPKL